MIMGSVERFLMQFFRNMLNLHQLLNLKEMVMTKIRTKIRTKIKLKVPLNKD
jgi:hypothetical protein